MRDWEISKGSPFPSSAGMHVPPRGDPRTGSPPQGESVDGQLNRITANCLVTERPKRGPPPHS